MTQTLVATKRRTVERTVPAVSAKSVRRMLRDIAFVLHMTRKVKRQILAEQRMPDGSAWDESFHDA